MLSACTKTFEGLLFPFCFVGISFNEHLSEYETLLTNTRVQTYNSNRYTKQDSPSDTNKYTSKCSTRPKMGLKAYSNMCESEHFRTCNGYVCQLKATEPVSIKRQSHSTPNCTLSVESTRTTSLCNPTVRYTALPFHPKRF